MVRKQRSALRHKCLSEDKTRGDVQNCTCPSRFPVARIPPCGKNVQHSPFVTGAADKGSSCSKDHILRNLSSAKLARYNPSGEKQTDLRALSCGSGEL